MLKPSLARIPARVRGATLLLLIVGAVATGSIADATGPDLRVAPGGTGNCVSSPCGSLVAAVRAAKSGDVIEMAAGTYGAQTISNVAGAASWSENVTVRPAPGAQVTTGSVSSYVPNLTFSDLRVNGFLYMYPAADQNEALRVDMDMGFVTGADDTVWASNSITPPPGQDGLQIKALDGDNATGTELLLNTIGPGYRVGASHTDCIQLLGAHDTLIRGNRILECANAGIQIGSGAGGTVNGVLIDNNVIDECHPQRDECPGYHTIIVGSEVADTVRIVNNTLNGSVGIAGTSGGAPVITGNTAVSLPCTPKTDGNVVQSNPCGPHDRIGTGPVTPPTTQPPTTQPPTTQPPTTQPPTTQPPTTQPPATQPPPPPPAGGEVTESLVQRVHSKAPRAVLDFGSRPGAVKIDLWVRGAYAGRAWATVELYDNSGRLIAQAVTGSTDRTSLQATLPAPGTYRVVVTSKPGEVNLTVKHPK